MAERRIRVGVLGAARNVPFTLLEPSKANPDLAARISVVGVASLDVAEAEKCAKEWGIPKAYKSFDDMLADSEVDAVYNVTPVGVRCHWNIRALTAGKHVLSETPMCLNANEALLAQRAAEDTGRILLEGTHPTCHPVTKRVRAMIMEGKVGSVEHIDLDLPVSHSLLGKVCSKTGALMGVGCHGVAIVRALCGEEPVVLNAAAQRSKDNPEVDEKMSANLKLPSGGGAHIGCSVAPGAEHQPTIFAISGSNGNIRVKEWFTGSSKGANEIELEQFEGSGHIYVERLDNPRSRGTFYYQLMAFVDEVIDQERRQCVGLPWSYTKSAGPSDAVRNMALIDSIYRAAGMKSRSTIEPPPAPYTKIGNQVSKL